MDSKTVASIFDEQYYATQCGQPYLRNEAWLAFFGSVADHIVGEIGPASALDAGCAIGVLVECLRVRGVAAFGLDVSEYAIDHVHPSVSPYCRLASAADPLPQRYDLITCIEVLEHMPAEIAQRTVANLCQYTDDILFSSTPFDYSEVTHFNVQPPEHWAELFARQGFYRDVDFDASFLTPWAVRFRRRHEPAARLVREYERVFWMSRKENVDLRAAAVDNRARMQEQAAVAQTARDRIAALEAENSRLAGRLAALEATPGWRVMIGLQGLRRRLAPPGSFRDRLLDAWWRSRRRAR